MNLLPLPTAAPTPVSAASTSTSSESSGVSTDLRRSPVRLERTAAIRRSVLGGVLGVMGLTGLTAHAEDADRFRTYMQWRSYEWDTIWGVDDANGISVGANLDRHWGAELALDSFQLGLRNTDDRLAAELTSISLIPQVRLRQPLWHDRLVPYVLAGVGTSFLQFNDRKSAGFGVDIEAEGWKLAATGGAGIEYFLDDNIAFGFEGKYMWIDELSTSIGGVEGKRDMSSFLLSFGLRLYFDENNPRPLADIPETPPPSRFYFGLRGGTHFILDGNWGPGVRLAPLANAWGHEACIHYGVALGMNLNRNWSVELTLDGGETDIQVADAATGKWSAIGEYAQAGIIPQVRYRWPLNRGRWVPYVQAGAGLLYAEFNDAKAPSVFYPGLEAKGFYPVARSGVGCEYFITRNFSFAGEANYQYTWDHEIDLPGRPTVSGDFSTFQALLMFRVYLFDL